MLYGVHGVDTMFMFCLFGLLWLIQKFNFVWLRQTLVSLPFKKTTVHINLTECFVS